MITFTTNRAVLYCLVTVVLVACGGGNPTNPTQCNPTTDSATYTVTFTGKWTATTHPGNFPSGAHFSAPVGAVHKTENIMWASGVVATTGIKEMAELGATGTVRNEINSYINNSDALSSFFGSGLGATGSSQFTITATKEHCLVSLTSMIAPSPDWFVGVRNVSLCENNQWVDSKVLQLNQVYDAGTDSGTTFNSLNANTAPRSTIGLVSDDGVHFLMTPLPLVDLSFTCVP